MLNLESKMEVLGVSVFQDFDRPTQFFYLPGPPHISREKGEPVFDLFSYRKGGEGSQVISGGFLNMAVDVSLGGLKNRVLNQLKQQYGDETNLAPVPFTRGTVRVIALGEDSQAASGAEGESAPSGDPLVAKGPRFIQNILGSGSPSLDGDNRAIFSFSLTEDGTAFFLEVLNGSVTARPVGVIYQLEYVGLLPAYDLEITINYKSCYDYMRSRFTLGTLFFRADVDNIVEDLKRKEAIKIKEVARTLELSKPEAIRERQNRIDRLVKDLGTGALFQPSLVPGEPRVKGDTITAADPTTSVPAGSSATMEALRRGPSAAVATGMGEAYGRAANPAGAAATGTGTPATGTGTPATGTGTPATGTGTTAAGTGGQPSTTSGQPAAATPSQPSRTGGAAALWNRLGRPQAAFALKSIRQEEERTVTYNLTQVSAQKKTVAPQNFIQFLADPRELNRRVHVVDLNHPFFEKLNINVNARDIDFAKEGITQMTVQLRYGTRNDGTSPKDSAEVILRSPEDSKDFTFFLDKKLTRVYEYRLVVDYRPDFGMGYKADRMEGPWIKTELNSLRAHPGQLGQVLPIVLELAPNTPEDLEEARAVIRYVHEEKGVDDSFLVKLDSENREATVHVRMVNPEDTFEVTTTLFYKDGNSETLPVQTYPDPDSGSSDDVVMVGVPAGNWIRGDIIMQDALGELKNVLVDTKIMQGEVMVDSRSMELSAANLRSVFSVRLPQPEPKPILLFRERRMYVDGGLEPLEWKESDTVNLVVGIPATRVMAVNIRYLGPPLDNLGLNAIVLDLSYADPEGDTDFEQSVSKLITTDPQSFVQEWKIRLADPRARTYQWKMSLLFSDGKESVGEPVSETRDLLTLRPQM